MPLSSRRPCLVELYDEAGDYYPSRNAASSAEPMARPDHRAKRHGRPSGKRRDKARANQRNSV
ncbi:hypothetical protein [Neorhizobium sp. JUb45]|uniref:hypothetical protein n=1 Tax=Neorhizobium sp. JUb45 TaxID=2485113 RepID=UPI001053A259|nr:hypothetical protein [Neorhizobium sp. JUb45]TCR07216.1 hypothetical protein EDF70_1011187 [Neorhizobium sp. JUb45]